MKMSKELYEELAADIRAAADFERIRLDRSSPLGDLWGLFHIVMRNRAYDDEHPGFRDGHWDRILDHIDRFWLDRFYKDEDLNDDHIATALRKIARTST